METVLVAPFAGRMRELLVSANDQVDAGPAAAAARAARATARPSRRRSAVERVELPEPAGARSPADRALTLPVRPAQPHPRLRPRPRTTAARALAGYHTARAESRPGRRPARRRRARGAVGLRRPVRPHPQPARCRGLRRRAGAQPARALPRLPALPRRRPGAAAAGLPGPARPAAHALRRRLPRPVPALEEAVFRVFLAQQRAGSHLPFVAALLERWLTEDTPVARRRAPPSGRAPARCSTGSSSRPSCATRSSATSPAACGSAGSRHRSSRPPAQQAFAAVRERLRLPVDAHPGYRGAPTHGRGARREPGAGDPLPRGADRARHLDARAAAGGARPAALPGVHPARHHDPRGRRQAAGHRGLHPRQPAEPPRDDGRGDVRAGRRRAPARRRGRGRARRARGVVDLYLAWADAPARVDGLRRGRCASGSAGCAFARKVRRVAVAVAGGADGKQLQRFTFRPSPDADAARPRGRPSSAACTRWSAGAWTCGGCGTSTSPGSRPRTTSCSTRRSPRTTRATSGSSCSPRCASCRSSGTPTARSPRCRRPSAPSRRAWTPSGAPARRCPAAPGWT